VTHFASPELQVLLSDEDAAGRIRVDLDVFVQFNATIDKSLSRLVKKWRRLAPPCATRGPGKRSRNKSA